MIAPDPVSMTLLRRRALSAVGYRNQARGYDPTSGEGARRFGGRFNPPGSFPVLYLCTTRPCVVAELTRQAARQGLEMAHLLPRELWRVELELTGVLELTDPAVLETLGIEARDIVRDDLRLTRRIGQAAYEQDFQAILTPSATGVDNVLVVFADKLSSRDLRIELQEEWNALHDIGA